MNYRFDADGSPWDILRRIKDGVLFWVFDSYDGEAVILRRPGTVERVILCDPSEYELGFVEGDIIAYDGDLCEITEIDEGGTIYTSRVGSFMLNFKNPALKKMKIIQRES